MDEHDLSGEPEEDSPQPEDFTDFRVEVPETFWVAFANPDAVSEASSILKAAIKVQNWEGVPTELGGIISRNYVSMFRGDITEMRVGDIEWDDDNSGHVDICFNEYVHSSCKDARQSLNKQEPIPFRVDSGRRLVFLKVLTWAYRFSDE